MVSSNQRPCIHWKMLAFFIVTALLAGGIGSLLGGGFDFESVVQPPLSPPAWLFPVVWTVLYVLMGIAAYLVWATRDSRVPELLTPYWWQLAVNALWPLFFFRLEWRLFAFFWLLLLVALVAYTMAGFRQVSRTAFWLLVPYLVWLGFAGYLNLGVYLLNM